MKKKKNKRGKKNQKNNLKYFIIAEIIVLVLIIVVISVVTRKSPQSQQPTSRANISRVDTNQTESLKLSGFGTIFDNYVGNLTTSQIANALEKITVKHLPNMYGMIKNYDNAGLEKFYSNNYKNLKSMFGIQDLETFVSFARVLKEKNIDVSKWDSLSILPDTFKNASDKEGYSYVEYEVTYKNAGSITFSAYIAQYSGADVLYMVNAIK